MHFGLSSIVSASDESIARITGAWHWVSPECIVGKGTRSTDESDVFSLGMCIIEGLRVVNSVKQGANSPAFSLLPWGDLDNTAVKAHLSRGDLPLRPAGCSDDEWRLVTQMCCHDPAIRPKISTGVDALADLRSSKTEESVSQVRTFDVKPVLERKQLPEVLSAMKNLLTKLRGNGMRRVSRKLKKNLLGRVDGRVEIWHLYFSLWKRIEHVYAYIVSQQTAQNDKRLGLFV
jgi:serine/threonine protein kinase